VAGASYWYHHCGKHRKAPEPAAKLCMCGLMEPSRAHLTWACPQTSAYRTAAALDIPADRASERLFAPPLEAYPPAPVTCHDEGPELCADLLAVVQNSPGDPGFVATDGSALDEVAGASVVLLTGGRPRTYGFSDDNEDQSSFRAELLALRAITASCRECLAQGRGPLADLYILCDCQAAILAVQSPDACALPALAREIANNLSVSGQAGFHVYIRWCPAHDRCPGWAPDFPLDASACRLLNDRADAKAKQIMRARHQASARAQWHTQQRLANEWSAAAIQLSSAAGDAYRRSCERRRLARIRLVDDDCDDAL